MRTGDQAAVAFLAAFAVLLVLSQPLPAAQLDEGDTDQTQLAGFVTDTRDRVLAGIPVGVRSVASGQSWTATTDSNGYWRVRVGSAGDYDVSVRTCGYKDYDARVKVPAIGFTLRVVLVSVEGANCAAQASFAWVPFVVAGVVGGAVFLGLRRFRGART